MAKAGVAQRQYHTELGHLYDFVISERGVTGTAEGPLFSTKGSIDAYNAIVDRLNNHQKQLAALKQEARELGKRIGSRQ